MRESGGLGGRQPPPLPPRPLIPTLPRPPPPSSFQPSDPRAAAVLAALATIPDPDLGVDIVTAGFVKGLTLTARGDVAFTLELTTPACPVKDEFRRAATAAVTALREQIAGGDPTVDTPAPADTSSSSPPIGYANGAGGVAYDDARVAGFLDGTRKTGQLYVCRAVSNGACASWSFCTASLIGNSLLLTAGHCIFSYGGGAGGWPKTIGGQLQVREDGG